MKLLMDLSMFKKVHQGGKDEVAYNLLRGFSQLGHANEIVCVARPELEGIVHSIDTNYQFIPLERNLFPGKIGEILLPFTDWIYVAKLRKIIKGNNCIKILFTNKVAPFFRSPVRTYLIPHDIQVFKWIEESNKFELRKRIYTQEIKLTFRLCDQIIAISDFDKGEMIKYIPSCKDRILKIYNPVRFKTVKLKENRTWITTLNIQHSHKNTLTLLKAYASIASKIKENLVLVGRKDFFPNVEQEINRIIEENHLADRVLFTGFVKDEELNSIISQTRVFINPSLYEGFGMAAVEMMESGIPTIVANNTAQKEVTMGLCRYYEPTTDEKALADAIMEELTYPTTKERLRTIANTIRKKYDYIEVAKEYWNTIMDESKITDKVCGKP